MNPFDKVLQALGDLVVRRSNTGASARCPSHHDGDPSLSVTLGNDGRVLIRCFAGCETEAILGALGLSWSDLFPKPENNRPHHVAAPSTWTPSLARRVWELAKCRVRDDSSILKDHDTYRYLGSRGLAAAWEEFGILHEDMEHLLPREARWWPREGYRVVCPLVDKAGRIVEIQARSIDPNATKKTLFPKGGSGRGRMFASPLGREVLINCSDDHIVLFGEGLTDYLALAIYSPVPVLCVPGVGAAKHALGDWCRGRDVVVALDCDAAGDAHVQDVADEVFEAGGRASRLTWPDDHEDACDVLAAYGDDGFMRFLDGALSEVETTCKTAKAQ